MNKVKIRKIFCSIILTIGIVSILLFLFFTRNSRVFKHDKYSNYKLKLEKSFNDGKILDAYNFGLKCLEINPNNVNDCFYVVKSLLLMNDYEGAEKYLEQGKNKCLLQDEKNEYIKLKNEIEEDKKKNEKIIKEHNDIKILPDFLKILYKNGVKIKKNKIDYGENNIRGLFAVCDVEEGEIIVEVPNKMLITKTLSKEFIIKKYAKECNEKEEEIKKIIEECYSPNNFYIALYILENIEKPEFKEYFTIILSNNYDSFPIFYNGKFLDIMKNTDLERKLYMKLFSLSHDIETLYKIKSVKKYDAMKLMKMYYAVSSRVFGYEIDENEETFLSPYIDMANHSVNKNTKWYYNDNKGCFCLEATKNINKGGEIFDSYGTINNTNLLMVYGFTIKNNHNLGILLQYNAKSYNCISNFYSKRNELMKLLKDIEINLVEGKKNGLWNLDLTKIEIKKIDVLKNLCIERLGKYKTKLKDDIKNLRIEEKNKDFNKVNCYTAMIDEKKMLNNLIKFSNNVISFIKKCGAKFTREDIDYDEELDEYSKDYLRSIAQKD